ncbi:hypothetical protein BYT27DRAFT_7251172 [Phlegmacium glaucopus]|nr:hypothetical protein BYT27DRAFT_7251172 [Phlegmacium glaucopus]
MYNTLCYIEVDTTDLSKLLEPQYGSHYVFYTLTVDVILSLGLTELKAYLGWNENGNERRSPAQVIHDPDTVVCEDGR